MADLAPFPDIHRLLIDLLGDLPAVTAVVETTGTDLQQKLPLIRVRRIGGDDNRISDTARVDVDVLAGSYAQAAQLAEQARQRLISGPRRTDHGILDRGRTEVGPHEVPYDDPAVRLITATYRLATRR